MGFINQVEPDQTLPSAAPFTAPGVRGRPRAPRVNWLFSGVLLGAGGWLLVLGVIFAVLGDLIVAAGLISGFLLCLGAVWAAGRRSRRVSDQESSAIA